MVMRRNILAALVLVTAGFTGGWFVLTPRMSNSTAMPTANIKASKRVQKGSSSMWQPVERNLVGVAQASETELAELDCHAPEGDVLRIDETTISAESFCDELEALAGAPPEAMTESWRQQARQLKDRLIDAELVRAALAEEGETIDENAVDEALARISHGQGGDETPLRAQLRARLEWNKLLELRASLNVTEEDLRTAYARDPAHYGEPARVTVTGYALRISPAASENDIAGAHQKVEQFHQEIARRDVAAAAKQLGLVALPAFDVEERGLESELAETALKLGSGQWSAPVRTKIGWIVVRVEKVRPAVTPPFDEVQDKVKLMVTAQQRRNAETNLKRELRDEARIEELVRF
jgi:hypothetical protein